MRLKLIGAVVGVLVLAVAVTASQAATIGQTVLKVTGSVNTKNAGTKKKPKGLTVKLNMRQTTTVPSDPRPATTKGFKIVFPSTWNLNSKKWPKKCALLAGQGRRREVRQAVPEELQGRHRHHDGARRRGRRDHART